MANDFQMTRIKFVEALWKANGCTIGMCTSLECGHIDIERSFHSLGITFLADNHDGTQYEFPGWSEDEDITMDQRDALSILNVLMTYGNFSKDQLFEGFMEVPKIVGELLHEHGWNEKLREADLQAPWAREATRKDFVLELVGEAFPDEYLDRVNR